MQLSVTLLLSLIYLATLAEAKPNHLNDPRHDSSVLKLRRNVDLRDPPTPPSPNTSLPSRASRSSSLSPEYWERIMTRIRDRGHGPRIDDTSREGPPTFRSASTGTQHRGVAGRLQLQAPGHLTHPNRSPASHGLPNGRHHLKPRAPRSTDSSIPPPNPPNPPNTPRVNQAPTSPGYLLSPPSGPRAPFPGGVDLRPTESIDEEFWWLPGPFQALAPAPRIDIPHSPGALPISQPLGPAAGEREQAPQPRVDQAVARLPNPSGTPPSTPSTKPRPNIRFCTRETQRITTARLVYRYLPWGLYRHRRQHRKAHKS
ncbi:hypothetical protein MMC30_000944 [Trapelia coarctata]|nr:hypothetical protein [Trapelia coarctata]